MKERTHCDEDLGVCDVCFYSETFENNYSAFFFFFFTISVVYIIYIIIFH